MAYFCKGCGCSKRGKAICPPADHKKTAALRLRFIYWLNRLARAAPLALGTAPAGLAGAVFQHDAHLGETVAGGIGGSPVLVGSSLVALGNEALDLGDFVVGLVALEEGVRILLQDAEHGTEFPQAGTQAGGDSDVFGLLAVDLAHQVEQGGVGFRGVEVVVHGLLEAGHLLVTTGGGGQRQIPQGGVHALQGGAGLLEVVFRVVELAAVVAGHQEVAHGLRIVVSQHVTDGEEVAEGLGHFLLVHHHHAAVHPGVDVVAAVGAAGLGDLVLVVGELQIGAAAVDVEVVAQVLGVHGGALDVPAGTARAPGAFPGRLAGFGHLPQHEVQGVALGIHHVDAGAGLQLLQILTGEPAVLVEGVDDEHDVTVVRHVGVAAIQQQLHHGDDLADVGGGARFDVRAHHAEGVEVLVHVADQALGEVVTGDLGLGGALDDLVVHVGDVAHIGEIVPGVAQVAGHHVEGDEGAAVADMTVIIDSDATHIHAHLARVDRFEFFFLTSECVVYLQHLMTTACE